MARHIRNRGRAGFTLIEMLLAASLTAAVCTAATMLIQSINQADSASREKYAGVAAARDTLSCIDMLVEEAALIGYSDDNRVLLWRNDDNGNGQINLAEMTLVFCDPDVHEAEPAGHARVGPAEHIGVLEPVCHDRGGESGAPKCERPGAADDRRAAGVPGDVR